MKPTILLQLDTDPQPSVFDAVVAIDAGVDHLLRHGGIEPGRVRELVFGTLFTRAGDDLKRTAIFVGGSNVAAGEALLKAVTDTFFSGFRVSVLFDANGANTTAAAAVLAALEGSGGSLQGANAAVLAGTGPVGQRAARLLARLGASVSIGSRNLHRAEEAARAIGEITDRPVAAFESTSPSTLAQKLEHAQVVISAGTTGVVLLPLAVRAQLTNLRVAIDLNAVPPLGVEGIAATDRGQERDGVRTWGALGVGATKMRIHKAAIRSLFEANDRVFDAEQVLALGQQLT